MELSAKTFSNRFSDGCFSNTWWSDEAQYFTLNRFIQFSNCDKLENPLFNIIHTIMTLIKNIFGHTDIKVLFRMNSIRHLGQILEIRLCHLPLAIMFLHLHKLLNFFVDHFHHFGGHRLILQIVKELFNLFFFFVRICRKMLF